jgi:hypothetical protein
LTVAREQAYTVWAMPHAYRIAVGRCAGRLLLVFCMTAAAVAAQEKPRDPVSDRKGERISGPDTQAICSQPPPAVGQAVVFARKNDRGIATQRFAEAGAQVVAPDVSGGPCPPPGTPRGRVAAAVGALLYKKEPHCSAVLVAPTMVVTAAHCVQDFDLGKLEFVTGEDPRKSRQRASVYNMKPHERYDADHLGVNDIAFVRLNEPIDVPPVTLSSVPLQRLVETPRTTFLLYVGYGLAGRPASTRRCVSIPVHDTCPTSFSYRHANMQTCHGDSGGGVFLEDDDDRLTLVGLTLWGDAACERYGVSADVGSYRDWINARLPPVRLPGRVQAAAIAAVALKRIRDREGEKRLVWAPTAFLGYEPIRRHRRVAVGVALGGAFAANTEGGFVIAATARTDVWGRWGVMGGYGFRIAPGDRVVRRAFGLGLTYRLLNLSAQ